MAKALMGFVGGPTVEQARETALLRRRINDLEAETLRLKIENDALGRALTDMAQQLTPADLLVPLAN